MADDLERLEEWVSPLLAKLDAKARRRLARVVATDLRRSQRQRIKSQRNPDGTPFEKRKPQRQYKPKNDPVHFIYKKPGGETREARMVSWQDQGAWMTGYDREAGAIRTFRRDRVEKWLPAKSGGSDAGKLRSKKGTVRNKAMFNKLSTAKYMRMRTSADSIEIGFFGRVASIAKTHQYGLRDRVSQNGPQVKYERRELLGFTDHDRTVLRDSLLDHLSGV